MDPNMVLSWHYYGGGKAILEEIYKSLNIDVVSYVYGPMPTQPLGWFKKPIAKVEDLKGLKYRTVGLAVDVFKELGVVETVGREREDKPVLYFAEYTKGVILNKTNADAVAAVFGDEEDDWPGHKLQLVTVPSKTPAGAATTSICMKPIVEKKKAAVKKATAVDEFEDPGYGVDDEVAA